MKSNIGVLIFITVFTIFGCKNDCTIKSLVDSEIELITNKEKRKNYLKSIFDVDQKVSLALTYVPNSIGQSENGKCYKMHSHSQINLIRALSFYEKFGYPEKDEFGDIASTVVWLVAHHEMEMHNRDLFNSILQKAFKEKKLKSSRYLLFLDRSYKLKYGKRPERGSRFTDAEEIIKMENFIF